MRRHLTHIVRELARTFGQSFDAYRPELHYMRGPGPKCLAKRDDTTAPAPPPVSQIAPTTSKIARAHA